MNIWQAVTADEYELPIAQGDTCTELARLMRVTELQIYKKRREEREGVCVQDYAVRVIRFPGRKKTEEL
jgi:hypothetical protein